MRSESREGDWMPNRIVILEFESMDKAKARMNSLEHREAGAMRRQAATSRTIVVGGL